MPDQPSLHIVGLQAEHFKRVRAVEIIPKGALVKISGRNAQGKTSVLDAIWAALGGKDAVPGKPIHTGEDRATIRLDMGEIIVTRAFTPTGTTLKVENAEGGTFKSPQTMLDGLMGAFTFDPLAFTRLSAKQQADELRRVAGLGDEFEKLDALNRTDFEKRATINKTAKEQRNAGEAIKLAVAPGKVDITKLTDKVQGITQQALARQTEVNLRAQQDQEIIRQAKVVEDLNEQIQSLVTLQNKTRAWVETAKAAVDQRTPLPEVDDPAALKEQIARAQEQNRVSTQIESEQQRRDGYLDRARELEGEAAILTERMDERTASKAKMLAEAAMPIPGLGFAEGIVTYREEPFDQASAAEQLRVSTAIAMAANPRIRVIRISDGSLLDDHSMAILHEMALRNDYQIWIEMVDSSGKVGVHIHDGMVAADNQDEGADQHMANVQAAAEAGAD